MSFQVKDDVLESFEGICYSGLLALAHKNGMQSIAVEIIQFPNRDNEMTAVCKATIIMQDGRSFVDVGDANPVTVKDISFLDKILRVASTRAKTRALKDALGTIIAKHNPQGKPYSKQGSAVPEITVFQINAIKRLCTELNIDFDPGLMENLNRVAASRLITQLSDRLKMTS